MIKHSSHSPQTVRSNTSRVLRTALIASALASAASMSLASAAFAQNSAPTQQQAAALPMPAAATGDFLIKVAAANKFEIDSSQLALKKSKSEKVQAFARMMLADHNAVAKKFGQAVTEARFTPPAEKLDAQHEALLKDLAKKDGEAFDQAYLALQKRAHAETVSLIDAYARDGENVRLKQFSREILPTLQKHLDDVSRIES